jgi:hypothetical protein
MADINSDSLKGQHRAGNIDNPVSIRFTKPIGEYKAGSVHTVDGSLAHHYTKVLEVAEPVGPPEPTDRAMKPPPRGKRTSTKPGDQSDVER